MIFQELIEYNNQVNELRDLLKDRYKDKNQMDRIENLLIDLIAMVYVGMIVVPRADKDK